MVTGRLEGGGDAGPGQEVDVDTPELGTNSGGFWNPPEFLQPPSASDGAEDILVNDYNWPREDAESAVSDGFWDSASMSGQGLEQFGSDVSSGDVYQNINYPDPPDFLPDWVPWAIGGTLGTVVLLAVVYIVGQLFTVEV